MPNLASLPDLTSSEWCSQLVQDMGINDQVLLGSAVVLLVLGILNIFLGYPIFRILLCIVAGLASGAGAYAFACQAFGGDIPASAIVAATAGVLGLIAFYRLYMMSVFIAGAALGWFLSYTFMDIFNVQFIPVVIAIAGVVCGLLALLVQKLAIIVATSLFGAIYTTLGVAQLVGQGVDPGKLANDPVNVFDWRNPDAKLIIMVAGILVLAGIGIFVQYKITGAMERKRKAPEKEKEEEKPEPEDKFED